MDGTQPIGEDTWSVAGRVFRSRLIVGTGKYKDYAQNAAAAASQSAGAPRSIGGWQRTVICSSVTPHSTQVPPSVAALCSMGWKRSRC